MSHLMSVDYDHQKTTVGQVITFNPSGLEIEAKIIEKVYDKDTGVWLQDIAKVVNTLPVGQLQSMKIFGYQLANKVPTTAYIHPYLKGEIIVTLYFQGAEKLNPNIS